MCFCLIVIFLRIDSTKGINHHEDFTTTFFWSGKPLVFGSHFSLLHPNIICCHHLSNCCIFWDQVSILLHPRVKGKSLGFFQDPLIFRSLRWIFLTNFRSWIESWATQLRVIPILIYPPGNWHSQLKIGAWKMNCPYQVHVVSFREGISRSKVVSLISLLFNSFFSGTQKGSWYQNLLLPCFQRSQIS